MNEEQQPQRRRGLFRFLPFLLIIGATIALIVLITNRAFNKVTEWSVSYLETNVLTSDSIYDLRVVQASEGEKSATIQGISLNTKNNTEFQFKVVVESSHFNNDFVVSNPPSGTVSFPYYQNEAGEIYHHKYSICFQYKVEEYRRKHPTVKNEECYYAVRDAFQVSWWDSWGPTIIMLGVSILIAIFLINMLTKSVGGANNKALSFNQSRAKKVVNSTKRFADVAGCDEEKAEMAEIVQYLTEPQKFAKLGAKLPKGILLVGPPGTGKTLLAKAVAGEAKVPFFFISGSDFVEMFVGVGAGRVRDMFRKAKQSAPCLIFIDEIDAVGRQRGAGLGGGNDEREQTLNQLLTEMDGFEDNSGIIVIAATNRDDVLDPALLRAGRFDRQITVSLPDKKGRAAIFKVHSRNKKLDSSIDFDALASRTVGFSGADIENIMNEAAILAVREHREIITIKDIDEAIDRRIAGPAKKTRSMTPQERKTVAYHEAGHAIIGLTIPESDKVQKITIVPRGQTGGHVLMTPENDRFILTKKELIARVVGYLGGRTSEEIFINDISTGAHNDIEVATRIARLMVTEYGMSKLGPIQYEKDTGSVFLGRDYTSSQKNFSAEIAIEIDKAVREIIEDAHEQARKIIKERKEDVILLAETLLEVESITAEQIEYLMKNRTLKKTDISPKKEEPKKESVAKSSNVAKEDKPAKPSSENKATPNKENKTITPKRPSTKK